MVRALFLYGVNCTEKVWDKLLPLLSNWKCDVLSYPHEVTKNAISLEDFANWVITQIRGKEYDVIVGHSLGGLIALKLAAESEISARTKIICLDSNLKPVGSFFRNLMTLEHMEEFGEEIGEMMANERGYYSELLFKSLQEDFDYTTLLKEASNSVELLLGDRNHADAMNYICELYLSEETMKKIRITLVPNCCHMIMIESPKELAEILNNIMDVNCNSKLQ